MGCEPQQRPPFRHRRDPGRQPWPSRRSAPHHRRAYTSDGAGGLLLSDVGGVWQAYPQPLRRITTGNVTSVGIRHYQLLECDRQHQCTESLLDRRDGHRLALSPRERSYAYSALSPTGTYRASLDGFDGGGTPTPRTTITRLGDHTVVQELPAPPNPAAGQPGSITWLSERWLLAIANGQISLYDTDHDLVLTPNFGFDNLLQLAWRPT